MNPDCRDGKHKACSGTAWDDALEAVAPCPCTCHTTPAGRRPTPPAPGQERITGL